jgi:hypothetical protein
MSDPRGKTIMTVKKSKRFQSIPDPRAQQVILCFFYLFTTSPLV